MAKRGITGKTAKYVFDKMWTTSKSAQEIIEEENLWAFNPDEELETIINIIMSCIEANPKIAEQYRKGNDKILGAMMAKVLAASNNKVSPKMLDCAAEFDTHGNIINEPSYLLSICVLCFDWIKKDIRILGELMGW